MTVFEIGFHFINRLDPDNEDKQNIKTQTGMSLEATAAQLILLRQTSTNSQYLQAAAKNYILFGKIDSEETKTAVCHDASRKSLQSTTIHNKLSVIEGGGAKV